MIGCLVNPTSRLVDVWSLEDLQLADIQRALSGARGTKAPPKA
jgi:hypothetical protein